MQRFENIFGGKIDRHVHFEERLSLAGNMCRAGKVCALVCCFQGWVEWQVGVEACIVVVIRRCDSGSVWCFYTSSLASNVGSI